MAAKRTSEQGDEPEGSSLGEWTLGEVWPFPSSAEIEARFEELIRRRWSGGAGQPPADVFVLGREVWVEIDLPGVERESVSVRFERGQLLVEAERMPTSSPREARPALLERIRGPLRRRVPLPKLAGRGRVEFELEGGVLRVRVVPEESD